MNQRDFKVGELVQLNPETCRNRMFAACIMTVTETKSFGAQGYVQALGADDQSKLVDAFTMAWGSN